MWINKKKLGITVILLNILLVMKLLKESYNIINLNYIVIIFIYLLSILVYWIFSVGLTTGKKKLSFIIVLIIALIGLIYFKELSILDVFKKYIIDNIEAIDKNLANGKATDFEQYKYILLLVIPIFSMIAMFLESKSRLKIFVFLDILILAFLWYLNYREDVSAFLFRFSFLAILIFYVDHKNLIKRRINNLNIRSNINDNGVFVSLLIYSFLLAYIISILPNDIRGKYEEKLDSKISNSITNGNVTTIKSDRYGLSYSGYNDSEKKLGGRIILNDELAFKVKADSNYYLKGNVKDKYTGDHWTLEEENRAPYQLKMGIINDTINKYPYLSNNKKSITIVPEYLKSMTAFTPNYVIDVNSSNLSFYYNYETQTFTSSKNVQKEYEVDFIDNSLVEQDIIKSKGNKIDNSYHEDIQKYRRIPDTITERTKDLVSSITKGATSDYEKIERIKKYLKDNYEYSLAVSDVPEGYDFVDYFLFEEKKGYCVYFATASTIMCRIAGVSARYVEGFKMPPNPRVDGFYYVTNKDAHAWSEVLLDYEKRSWITLETTVTPNEFAINLASQSQNNGEGIMEQQIRDRNISRNQKELNEQGEQTVQNNATKSIKFYDLIKIVLGALLIYILIKIVLEIIRKIKVIKSSNSLDLYLYAERRLKSLGLKRSRYESEMDFAKTIKDDKFRVEFEKLILILYEEYYGEIKNTDFSKKNFYIILEEYLKKQGFFKYYLKKYLIPYRLKRK